MANIPTKAEQDAAEAAAREDGKKQQAVLDGLDKPDKKVEDKKPAVLTPVPELMAENKQALFGTPPVKEAPTPSVTPAGSPQAFQPKSPEQPKPGESKLGMVGSKV